MDKMEQDDSSNTFANGEKDKDGNDEMDEMWGIPMSCCDVTAENTADLLTTWMDSQASAFCTDYTEEQNCDAYKWEPPAGVERECGNDFPNTWWGQHVSARWDCTKHLATCKVTRWKPKIFNITIPVGEWIHGLLEKTVCKALESEEFQDKIDATAKKFCTDPNSVIPFDKIKTVLGDGIKASIKAAGDNI